jgi:hypothetical protein
MTKMIPTSSLHSWNYVENEGTKKMVMGSGNFPQDEWQPKLKPTHKVFWVKEKKNCRKKTVYNLSFFWSGQWKGFHLSIPETPCFFCISDFSSEIPQSMAQI